MSRKLIVLVSLCALLFSVGMLACGGLSEEPTLIWTPSAPLLLTPKPPTEKLALISSRCSLKPDLGIGISYITCEGFVENISGEPLENVWVVILWYDDAGVPVSSDLGLVSYNPILPGQQSPWGMTGIHDPAITSFRIEFKELLGGTIPPQDDRPTEER